MVVSGERRTVLVVSGDTRLALSIERLIERRELGDVFIAGSREQASALIDSIVFTTIVVDVSLPGKQGIALLMEVGRAHPDLHRVALGQGSHRAMFRLVERDVAHVALPTPLDVHEFLTGALQVASSRCGDQTERLTRSSPPADDVRPPAPAAPGEVIEIDFTPVRGTPVHAGGHGQCGPTGELEREEGTPHEVIEIDFTPVRAVPPPAPEAVPRPLAKPEPGTPEEVVIDFTPIGDPHELAQVAERARAREQQRARAGRRRPRRGRFP